MLVLSFAFNLKFLTTFFLGGLGHKILKFLHISILNFVRTVKDPFHLFLAKFDGKVFIFGFNYFDIL